MTIALQMFAYDPKRTTHALQIRSNEWYRDLLFADGGLAMAAGPRRNGNTNANRGLNQYALSGTAAEMYDRNMVPAIFEPFARDLLEFANLKAGEKVLDVACGTGIVARLAWPKVSPSPAG
jgi:2-polyprenyl-3-methyl-5-hydroxy-6-metoxy-1,4-benzoquinol methylase